MKIYKCSIEITAENLDEAKLRFYDLTKHWNDAGKAHVVEKYKSSGHHDVEQYYKDDPLTPEEQGRIDMGSL